MGTELRLMVSTTKYTFILDKTCLHCNVTYSIVYTIVYNHVLLAVEKTDPTGKICDSCNCDKTVSATGWVSHARYPNYFHPNLGCTYTLRATDPSQQIVLTFTDFDVCTSAQDLLHSHSFVDQLLSVKD